MRRRVYRPRSEHKAIKAAYDEEYRRRRRAEIRANKKAYFARTYDPAKARLERKKRARWHVEYCRRYYSDPKKKRAKVNYDLERRAAEYGPYAEAYKVFLALRALVLKLVPCKYERLRARGYYEREAEKQRARRADSRRAP